MAYTPPIIPSVPNIASGPSGVASQQNPPHLPPMPPGTIVQGTVAGVDAKGNPVIQNEVLQLVLSTRFPLGKGAQLSIRIDPPVTRDAAPSFRILSVDGQPPVQTPAAARPQAEAARPIGILLEVIARPTGTAAKPPVAPAPAEAPPQQPAMRGVAAEVVLSEGQKAAAVLLRPAFSDKAALLMAQLAARTGAPLPVPVAALRPGLQLQVQIVQIPPPQLAGTAIPNAPKAGTPPQPASPQVPPASAQSAHATTPLPTGAAATGQPQPSAPLTTPSSPPAGAPTSAAPLPQFRAGYAQYARQAPAVMPGAPVSPPPAAPQSPQVSGVSSPLAASPATPVQTPPGLTPQVVEQLLVRAEAKLPQGQMAAVVMGREQGGALIVQTRLGMFTLPQVQADSAQPGTVLTWRVEALRVPQPGESLPPIAGSGGLVATASQFTSAWSALEELSTLLHGMQSSVAAQALQRMVPHVGSQFSAGLLFFMTVLRRGDVSEWLGRDMVEHLERMGKGDLVQRLGGDMGALRSLFAEPQPGNWQALFFPVMVDKQLHQAQMFVKPDEGRARKDGSGGTRFIVELELSNLGPMQMDGLVKKRAAGSQFDLVIRSMAELPEKMKADIYAIFDNAQQVTGLSGALHFRLVQEFPVNPLQEMQRDGEEGPGGIMA